MKCVQCALIERVTRRLPESTAGNLLPQCWKEDILVIDNCCCLKSIGVIGDNFPVLLVVVAVPRFIMSGKMIARALCDGCREERQRRVPHNAVWDVAQQVAQFHSSKLLKEFHQKSCVIGDDFPRMCQQETCLHLWLSRQSPLVEREWQGRTCFTKIAWKNGSGPVASVIPSGMTEQQVRSDSWMRSSHSLSLGGSQPFFPRILFLWNKRLYAS